MYDREYELEREFEVRDAELALNTPYMTRIYDGFQEYNDNRSDRYRLDY